MPTPYATSPPKRAVFIRTKQENRSAAIYIIKECETLHGPGPLKKVLAVYYIPFDYKARPKEELMLGNPQKGEKLTM
jgi:hypothetical protein